MDKEKKFQMYDAVDERAENLFDDIHRKVEWAASILVDAGYTEEEIKEFIKEAIYPCYIFIF